MRRLVQLLVICAVDVEAYLWSLDDTIDKQVWRNDGDSFRIRPHERVGILGSDCLPESDLHCGGYMDYELAFRSGDFETRAGVIVYARDVESALHGEMRSKYGSMVTACALLQPEVLNDENAFPRVHRSIRDKMLHVDYVEANTTFVSLLGTFKVVRSELWIVTVAFCTNEVSSGFPRPARPSMSVPPTTGQDLNYVQVMSPTGHLLLVQHQIMQFHEYNVLGLAGALALWIAYCTVYMRYFNAVHLCMAGVLVVSASEQLCFYFLYHEWNITGDIPQVALYFGTSMLILRRVFWTLSLLLLGFGYKVIHAGISDFRVRLVGSMVAFTAGQLLYLYDPLGENEMAQGIINLCDTAMFFYTVHVACITRYELREKNQKTKEQLFANLTYLLTFYFVAELVCMVGRFIFIVADNDLLEKAWRYWWILHCYRPVLFDMFLLTLMVAWRPSESTAQLLHAFELTDESPAE
ncbi:hypothetical protein DIPPA_16650, partial [Diplonema papillatum]